METKICKTCGRELTVNNFRRNSKTKDGYRNSCCECEDLKKGTSCKFTPGECFTDPALSNFSPRQLINELKARGYSGELKFIQVIKV